MAKNIFYSALLDKRIAINDYFYKRERLELAMYSELLFSFSIEVRLLLFPNSKGFERYPPLTFKPKILHLKRC